MLLPINGSDVLDQKTETKRPRILYRIPMNQTKKIGRKSYKNI